MKTLILCSALVALATPAFARVQPVAGDPDVLQTSVSYADLDLTRPAGADVMIARVRRAAQQVCGQELFAEHNRARHISACVRTAMDGAFAQLDAPLVTARYAHAAPPARLATR